MKGASVKSAMGACMSSREKRSPTVPPDTERKADPARPWRKRVTMMVSMFCATAEGIRKMRKDRKETR